jgi:hypothetical protein
MFIVRTNINDILFYNNLTLNPSGAVSSYYPVYLKYMNQNKHKKKRRIKQISNFCLNRLPNTNHG